VYTLPGLQTLPGLRTSPGVRTLPGLPMVCFTRAAQSKKANERAKQEQRRVKCEQRNRQGAEYRARIEGKKRAASEEEVCDGSQRRRMLAVSIETG